MEGQRAGYSPVVPLLGRGGSTRRSVLSALCGQVSSRGEMPSVASFSKKAAKLGQEQKRQDGKSAATLAIASSSPATDNTSSQCDVVGNTVGATVRWATSPKLHRRGCEPTGNCNQRKQTSHRPGTTASVLITTASLELKRLTA